MVKLCVRLLSVAVTTTQLVYTIVLSVCREHAKAVKAFKRDNKGTEDFVNKAEQNMHDHASQWVKSTQPNKIIQALGQLREAAELFKDEGIAGNRSELKTLATTVLDNVCLAGTHILNQKAWRFLKTDGQPELDWYSPEWLKS